jgi:hypothetical protein
MRRPGPPQSLIPLLQLEPFPVGWTEQVEAGFRRL